jgi:hypothetical protein
MSFKPTSYQLLNVKTGRIFKDSGWDLKDPQSSENSLVRISRGSTDMRNGCLYSVLCAAPTRL